MNILLTNDDGFDAPGLHAAFQAVRSLGTVYVVAPKTERSACSHMITLRAPIRVERRTHHEFYGTGFAVDGTPADCVRLALSALMETRIDLILSGINRGANAGVDIFYSGTVAGAREGAILGVPAIAVSQGIRSEVELDWAAASAMTRHLIETLIEEELPGPGFWNVNLPSPIPDNPREHIHRVPVAAHPMPMSFSRNDKNGVSTNERSSSGDSTSNDRATATDDASDVMEFEYGASYWLRDVTGPSDYNTIRDGGIAVTAVPLFGGF